MNAYLSQQKAFGGYDVLKCPPHSIRNRSKDNRILDNTCQLGRTLSVLRLRDKHNVHTVDATATKSSVPRFLYEVTARRASIIGQYMQQMIATTKIAPR